MTSRVLSLFFLLSLFPSITAADPTGFTLRITDKAQGLLKELTVALLKEIVNGPFSDFDFKVSVLHLCTIKELTLTLTENQDQTFVHLLDDGLEIDIRGWDITAQFHSDSIICLGGTKESPNTLTVRSLSAKITLTLIRNDGGKLNIKIKNCEVSNVNLGQRWIPSSVGQFLFEFVFCSKVVQGIGVPNVNTMMESLTMVMKMPGNQNTYMDYSLSKDIKMSPTSIDVPIKGSFFNMVNDEFQEDTTMVSQGSFINEVNVNFQGDAKMIYITFTKHFFNNAAAAFFSAKTFETSPEKVRGPKKAVLKMRQLFKQRWHLKDKMYEKLRITEVPKIIISESGFSIDVRGKVEASSTPESREEQDFTASATCQITVHVQIQMNRLTLSSNRPSCQLITSNKIKAALAHLVSKKLEDIVKSFLDGLMSEGIPLPLPEGVDITDEKVSYHKDYVTVEGNLRCTEPTTFVRSVLTCSEN